MRSDGTQKDKRANIGRLGVNVSLIRNLSAEEVCAFLSEMNPHKLKNMRMIEMIFRTTNNSFPMSFNSNKETRFLGEDGFLNDFRSVEYF